MLQNAGEEDTSSLPEDIPWSSHTFPFVLPVGETADQVRASLFESLPEITKARQLIETYYRHAGWMCVIFMQITPY